MGKTRVVIIGAGMGGAEAAKALADKDNVEVTIVDQNNYQLFQALLYQVSTAVLGENEIAYPIRAMFRKYKNVDFFLGEVTDFDTEKQLVITKNGEIPYDYLIVATGSTTNFFGMKSIEAGTFPMKTLDEAAHIRDHVLRCLERANYEEDEEKRKALLRFVCVGAGPTGVEECGAILEWVEQTSAEEYHRINLKKEVDVKLIEMTGEILPMMPPKLREKALKAVRNKGVDVRLKTAVKNYENGILTLECGGEKEEIACDTVIWAAGVRAVPIVAKLNVPSERDGRIILQKNLTIKELPNVYVIGDSASFKETEKSRPLATIAPVAMQEGKCAAKNILRRISGQEQQAFVYKDLGSMAMIGRFDGVVAKGSIQFDGLIAWTAWLGLHLQRLAGLATNVTVAYKWLLNTLSQSRLHRITSDTNNGKE